MELLDPNTISDDIYYMLATHDSRVSATGSPSSYTLDLAARAIGKPSPDPLSQKRSSSSSSQQCSGGDSSSPPISEEEVELDELCDVMDDIDMSVAPFVMRSTVKADILALYSRIVESLLIVLAVNHSDNLEKTTPTLYVLAILLLLVYFGSQVKYFIIFWTKNISIYRRFIAREEESPSSSSASAQQQLSARVSLAQVRLASSELQFSFVSLINYLVMLYVTYILVRDLIEWIDTAFSSVTWNVSNVIVLILLGVPIYVESAVSGYGQDAITRFMR